MVTIVFAHIICYNELVIRVAIPQKGCIELGRIEMSKKQY